MRRTISTIAAALFAATVSAQSGCSHTQHSAIPGGQSGPVPGLAAPDELGLALDLREENVRRAIADIAGSTHCIRTQSQYRRIGATADEPLRITRSHGTAFAYEGRGGYTYLVTNVHVLRDDDVRFLRGPEGIDVPYRLVQSSHFLVDDGRDRDSADDIALEVMREAEDIDIAVVRTEVSLPVADSYVRDPSFTPEFGDDVYIVGFPQAWELTVTRGIVSNPVHRQVDGSVYELLDSTSTFGNSGSAYFVRRGDTLYLAGVTGMVRMYAGSRVTLYAMGTPLSEFDDMLEGGMPSGASSARSMIRLFDRRLDRVLDTF